jgi:hypothetical protein
MKTKTTATPARPKTGPCSCGGQGGSECTCGQAVCFERPNYFCGQLLNDTDLSAGQTYVREKLKLYHRTLHGWGVVCGLRLTCDRECDGRVRIGDGYAIDDCGNDLVVCEPAHFNVIAALKAKDWLITEEHDPCEKEKEPPCKVKQCYYLGACYCEEEAEFTTPFKTNCGPGAAACVPTRIKESVRFDVLDKLPKHRNVLDEIEERITCCWKVFTEGPLARSLKELICDARAQRREGMDYCRIFCQLKVLFEHYLKRRPDPYDCTLWEQVCKLQCPEDEKENYDRYKDSFCKLFALIRQYAIDCVLGEMIFQCPNPPRANCVVLGTVEVEDGKILRVCNCPRTYVWSFANFFEVLLAELVGGAACAGHDEKPIAKKEEGRTEPERRRHHGCCATFEFDCDQFLELFCARQDFCQHAVAAPVHATREVVAALRRGFNFTHPMAFSPEVFKGMQTAEALQLAQRLAGRTQGGSNVLDVIKPDHYEAPDPITALLSRLLKLPGDPLVATPAGEKGQETVAQLAPRSQLFSPLAQDVGQETRLKAAEDRAANAEKGLADLTSKLADLQAQLKAVADRQAPAPPAAPPPPTPTPPSGPVETK